MTTNELLVTFASVFPMERNKLRRPTEGTMTAIQTETYIEADTHFALSGGKGHHCANTMNARDASEILRRDFLIVA